MDERLLPEWYPALSLTIIMILKGGGWGFVGRIHSFIQTSVWMRSGFSVEDDVGKHGALEWEILSCSSLTPGRYLASLNSRVGDVKPWNLLTEWCTVLKFPCACAHYNSCWIDCRSFSSPSFPRTQYLLFNYQLIWISVAWFSDRPWAYRPCLLG